MPAAGLTPAAASGVRVTLAADAVDVPEEEALAALVAAAVADAAPAAVPDAAAALALAREAERKLVTSAPVSVLVTPPEARTSVAPPEEIAPPQLHLESGLDPSAHVRLGQDTPPFPSLLMVKSRPATPAGCGA